MYIIAQGQVEILKRDADGEMQTALFLGEGQVFGELALLDQGLRTATIIADEDPTDRLCAHARHVRGLVPRRHRARLPD